MSLQRSKLKAEARTDSALRKVELNLPAIEIRYFTFGCINLRHIAGKCVKRISTFNRFAVQTKLPTSALAH